MTIASAVLLRNSKLQGSMKQLIFNSRILATINSIKDVPYFHNITLFNIEMTEEQGQSNEATMLMDGEGEIIIERMDEHHPEFEANEQKSVTRFATTAEIMVIDDWEEKPPHLEGDTSSYLQMEFESEEMIKFLAYQQKEQPKWSSVEDMTYKQADLFPEWVMNDPQWQGVKKANSGTIMDILNIPESQRTPEHTYQLNSFVMAAWETASQLGHKRCAELFKDFKHVTVDAGERIVAPDETCSSFYIIVSGEVILEKKREVHAFRRHQDASSFTSVSHPPGSTTSSFNSQTSAPNHHHHGINYHTTKRSNSKVDGNLSDSSVPSGGTSMTSAPTADSLDSSSQSVTHSMIEGVLSGSLDVDLHAAVSDAVEKVTQSLTQTKRVGKGTDATVKDKDKDRSKHNDKSKNNDKAATKGEVVHRTRRQSGANHHKLGGHIVKERELRVVMGQVPTHGTATGCLVDLLSSELCCDVSYG